MSDPETDDRSRVSARVRLFLCGDVMLGRGIDQILPHPADPRLYEPHVVSARTYVELAERLNGAIPRPVDFSYVWGDAIAELERLRPDARIINLETSITTSTDHEPKGINYKMNPANSPCLTAASINCCVLANNHVLDWGRAGLVDTLGTLAMAGVHSAGAGRNAEEAEAPAIVPVAGGGRVLIFAFGSVSSGIPPDWAATPDRPGVNLLDDMSGEAALRLARRSGALKQRDDILVASIHWGGNWGYRIADEQTRFAHHLVDSGFDIVHGHSSHHPKAIEIYQDKLILYGCGDFLNDYEGIRGYERFRNDLAAMYVADLAVLSGRLVDLELIPFQIRRFRLNRAERRDAAWLGEILDREGGKFDTRVVLNADNTLTALWRRG